MYFRMQDYAENKAGKIYEQHEEKCHEIYLYILAH